jgi:hypothetical protein
MHISFCMTRKFEMSVGIFMSEKTFSRLSNVTKLPLIAFLPIECSSGYESSVRATGIYRSISEPMLRTKHFRFLNFETLNFFLKKIIFRKLR